MTLVKTGSVHPFASTWTSASWNCPSPWSAANCEASLPSKRLPDPARLLHGVRAQRARACRRRRRCCDQSCRRKDAGDADGQQGRGQRRWRHKVGVELQLLGQRRARRWRSRPTAATCSACRPAPTPSPNRRWPATPPACRAAAASCWPPAAARPARSPTTTRPPPPATLTVNKIVVNDDGGTKVASDFSFSVNGAAPVAFEADGSNVLSVPAGTYTVTEPAAAGYAASLSGCSSIVLAAGASATCTITNNDPAPPSDLSSTGRSRSTAFLTAAASSVSPMGRKTKSGRHRGVAQQLRLHPGPELVVHRGRRRRNIAGIRVYEDINTVAGATLRRVLAVIAAPGNSGTGQSATTCTGARRTASTRWTDAYQPRPYALGAHRRRGPPVAVAWTALRSESDADDAGALIDDVQVERRSASRISGVLPSSFRCFARDRSTTLPPPIVTPLARYRRAPTISSVARRRQAASSRPVRHQLACLQDCAPRMRPSTSSRPGRWCRQGMLEDADGRHASSPPRPQAATPARRSAGRSAWHRWT